MTPIETILLIPNDPKLLGDPTSVAWRCGARVPLMTKYNCNCGKLVQWRAPLDFETRDACPECRERTGYCARVRALVLMHEGEILHRSMDALERAEGATPPSSYRLPYILASHGWLDGMGTLLYLDNTGKDVTP
jgi:hypothetical protein